MKLYEYKAKATALLLNYEPTSDRERYLRDHLLTKVSNLRTMTLSTFLRDLALIIDYEDVSDGFKEVLRKMIPSPEEIDRWIGEGEHD